jgi:hypothetical protein
MIIDSEKMYDNVMNHFKFGGLAENPDYYMDETTARMAYTHRVLFASLAERLIKEGQNEKALNVLDYAEKVIPGNLVPHSAQVGAASMASSYIKLGEKSKAMNIIDATCGETIEYLQWYESLSKRHHKAISYDHTRAIGILQMLIEVIEEGGEPYKAEATRYKEEFGKHYSYWRNK